MLEFIKMFGLGVLYTVLSPVFLLVFLLFVVYSLFNYLVFEVINVIGFFAGKRFTEETDLDKKLKKMKEQGLMGPAANKGGDHNA
ncbi:MAG: hypothetical protein IKJ30_04420 [Bacilli bacterium]|nr:hypothetical protein [Bacilli bacterium]